MPVLERVTPLAWAEGGREGNGQKIEREQERETERQGYRGKEREELREGGWGKHCFTSQKIIYIEHPTNPPINLYVYRTS